MPRYPVSGSPPVGRGPVVSRRSHVAITLFLAGIFGCGASTPPNGQVYTSVRDASHVVDDAALRDDIDEVLAFTQRRHLDVETNAAWQIVHGILAFGPSYRIYVKGELVPALDYLLQGGQLRGWTFRPGEKGLQAVVEGGTKTGQGHQDQWLGYLSHCELPPDQTLIVDGRTFTIADLLDQACWDCRQGQEASWTLMGLSSYLPSDAEWVAADGQTWSLERLIALETAQDLGTSACGGTHRLYGMTTALRRRQEQFPSEQLSGGWKAADEKIRWAIQRAREFQQPDGSFSTAYFQRAASSSLVGDRLGATGHVLEFLALALDDQEIQSPWVAHAASYLCRLMRKTRDEPLECGALFHAAHGLVLYRQRRFGPMTPSDTTTRESELAMPREGQNLSGQDAGAVGNVLSSASSP